MITYKIDNLGTISDQLREELKKLTLGGGGMMHHAADGRWPETISIAFDGNRPIGWATTLGLTDRTIEDNTELIGVFVNENYRNKRIGTDLVKVLIHKIKDKVDKIIVSPYDKRSHSFYKKLGGKEYGEKEDWGHGSFSQQRLKEADGDESRPSMNVVVGSIDRDYNVISKRYIKTHCDLMDFYNDWRRRETDDWRYVFSRETVFWWNEPDDREKEIVEKEISEKYNAVVKRHLRMGSSDDPGEYFRRWPVAHGLVNESQDLVILGKVDDYGVQAKVVKDKHESHPKEWKFGERWRYDIKTKTVWWWADPVPKDDGLAVEDWLESHGYTVERHRNMMSRDFGGTAISGFDRFFEGVGGKHIVVGITSGDAEGVFGSDKVPGHSELYWKFVDKTKPITSSPSYGAWRYNPNDQYIYWWDKPNDKQSFVTTDFLKRKYGYKIKGKKLLSGHDVKSDAYRQTFFAAHGYEPPEVNKLSEALDDKPIVVGATTDDGVMSSDSVDTHDELDTRLFTYTSVAASRQGLHWRYNPQHKVVYWWGHVGNEIQQSDVEAHLKKKYGYGVKLHLALNHRTMGGDQLAYRNRYKAAHGTDEGVMSLKALLMEGVMEKAAEDFIKQTIQGTEWQGKVFVAGGYVRDELLGRDPKDLDLLVNKPNGGIEFANWITKKIGAYKEGSNPVTYPRFGTAKFNLKGVVHNGQDLSNMDIEAVMPRKEQYTAGSRKPDVTAGDLADDVSRRDFTVNSLLKDLSTGEVLDLTGMGKEDLKKGIVRTPLDPDKIFTDDPLRQLRAIRFAVKYNWKLPMFMIRGLKKNAPQLQNISQERIRDELDKMLMTGSPAKAIKLLKITGLLKYVIPELIPAIKMTQNKFHSKDVFSHTLDVLSKTNPVLIQRLTGLFHDIGKVITRSVTPTGVHFYGHEYEGEKMVRDIMARLKYPNELIDAVALGVKSHMRLKSAGDTGVSLSDKALRKFKIEVGDNLENILGVIHADNIAHSEASSMPNQINHIRKRLEALNMNVAQGKPRLPITGNDLKEMGLKPGPIFSEIMKAVTEAWYENPNITKEQGLEIARRVSGK